MNDVWVLGDCWPSAGSLASGDGSSGTAGRFGVHEEPGNGGGSRTRAQGDCLGQSGVGQGAMYSTDPIENPAGKSLLSAHVPSLSAPPGGKPRLPPQVLTPFPPGALGTSIPGEYV